MFSGEKLKRDELVMYTLGCVAKNLPSSRTLLF